MFRAPPCRASMRRLGRAGLTEALIERLIACSNRAFRRVGTGVTLRCARLHVAPLVSTSCGLESCKYKSPEVVMPRESGRFRLYFPGPVCLIARLRARLAQFRWLLRVLGGEEVLSAHASRAQREAVSCIECVRSTSTVTTAPRARHGPQRRPARLSPSGRGHMGHGTARSRGTFIRRSRPFIAELVRFIRVPT